MKPDKKTSYKLHDIIVIAKIIIVGIGPYYGDCYAKWGDVTI